MVRGEGGQRRFSWMSWVDVSYGSCVCISTLYPGVDRGAGVFPEEVRLVDTYAVGDDS
jgi:hypothetical protein